MDNQKLSHIYIDLQKRLKDVERLNRVKESNAITIQKLNRGLQKEESEKLKLMQKVKESEKLTQSIALIIEENGTLEDIQRILNMEDSKQIPEFDDMKADLWDLFQKVESFFKSKNV